MTKPRTKTSSRTCNDSLDLMKSHHSKNTAITEDTVTTSDTNDSASSLGGGVGGDDSTEEDGGFVVSVKPSPLYNRRNSLGNQTDHSAVARRRTLRRGEQRRGSCTMISKSHRDMDDEDLCATLAGEEVELKETLVAIAKQTKKKQKKSSPPSPGEQIPLTRSTKHKASPSKSGSSSSAMDSASLADKSNESSAKDQNGGKGIPEVERLKRANEKIQMMFLEQRRKERAARLDAAKERIRKSKEEEAAKAKLSKKKKSSSSSSKSKASSLKSPSARDDSDDNSGDDADGSAKVLPEQQRREIAYQWYMRCGMPTKEGFRSRIERMEGVCDITPSDIDLLPWIHDGARVDVKQLLYG